MLGAFDERLVCREREAILDRPSSRVGTGRDRPLRMTKAAIVCEGRLHDGHHHDHHAGSRLPPA
jgi:hypothetical protein